MWGICYKRPCVSYYRNDPTDANQEVNSAVKYLNYFRDHGSSKYKV